MDKESIFNFSEKLLKKIRKTSREPEQRVVIGFKENEFGQAVVTTVVPVMYNPNKVTYVKKRTNVLWRLYDR